MRAWDELLEALCSTGDQKKAAEEYNPYNVRSSKILKMLQAHSLCIKNSIEHNKTAQLKSAGWNPNVATMTFNCCTILCIL